LEPIVCPNVSKPKYFTCTAILCERVAVLLIEYITFNTYTTACLLDPLFVNMEVASSTFPVKLRVTNAV